MCLYAQKLYKFLLSGDILNVSGVPAVINFQLANSTKPSLIEN